MVSIKLITWSIIGIFILIVIYHILLEHEKNIHTLKSETDRKLSKEEIKET